MHSADDLSAYLHVVAGIVRNAHGDVLIARRPQGVVHGGLWEFPGGKVEPAEAPFDALRRELAEELGITVQSARPLIRVPHRYAAFGVLLEVWQVEHYGGTPVGREGQALAWVPEAHLSDHTFPAADLPVIGAVRLPDRYLITPDPGPDEARWTTFLARLERLLEGGIRLVQLRARSLDERGFERLGRAVATRCQAAGAVMLVNVGCAGAGSVPCQGVHLPAPLLMGSAARPAGAEWVAASCHNAAEIERAAALGVDFVVLSPVRPTASHPHAAALGWGRFASLVARAPLPVFALGGVSQDDIATARACGAQGIAAITGIWNSPLGTG